MKSQRKQTRTSEQDSNINSQTSLKRTDRAVLKYLDEITKVGGRDTCTASIPKIASVCKISKRQVQIITKRLIQAGLIERVGYDFGNPDRTKRGTIYKLLINQTGTNYSVEVKRKSIKLLLLWSEG
jgi:hypothetical protein